MLKKTLKTFIFGVAIFCIVFSNIFVSSSSWGHTWVTYCEQNSVDHAHNTWDWTYEYKLYLNNYVISTWGCIDYTHILPTRYFNCHAFAYNMYNYALGDGEEVEDVIWPDDFEDASWPYQLGDRVAYYKDGDITHSGVVAGVSGGYITAIDSKWGLWGLYRHEPTCVPSFYGTMDEVKQFNGCEKKSSGGEDPKKDYEYSLEKEIPIMDEERLVEAIGPPENEFNRAERAEEVEKLLESYKKGEIDLNQIMTHLTSYLENWKNNAEFLLASDPVVEKMILKQMPEVQGLIAIGNQVVKPLTDKLNDENLKNKTLSVPAYNYILEILNVR